MLIRVGIHPSPRYGTALRALGAAGMISANALRKRACGFRSLPPKAFGGLEDVALDSAGFVAMFRYGGYRWSVEDYVRFAASYPWSWWAQMDFCCEPEIAGNRDEVLSRIQHTVEHLALCRRTAELVGARPPMPVLQGRSSDDYLRCAEMMGDLPALVGLGSVCRRALLGEDGLIPVVEHLDRQLQRGVRLHLFGVKGSAIPALLGHPRIASVDSFAHDFWARMKLEKPVTVEKKINAMIGWWQQQTSHRNLFGAAS